MEIDPPLARALGFPRAQYTGVERERRWLCHGVPRSQIRQTLHVTDRYVTGSRLRLREMRPSDGAERIFKLTRKADVDARTRLLTTIYLSEHEYLLLAAALPGTTLTKIRHRLHASEGWLLSIDEFDGERAGLILAEAECDSMENLVAFPTPEFALREVTGEPEYTGSWLAHNGLPR
jgi:CYTH domain-containing protein